MKNPVIALCENEYCADIKSVEPIAQSGSNRRYYRLKTVKGNLIGVEGTSLDENKAFIALSQHFLTKGLPVPRVVAVSHDSSCYLQEDLGAVALFDALKAGRESGQYDASEKELLKKTIALLPDIQVNGAKDLDFSVCYPQPAFDARMIAFDLNYFKYCFLKSTGLEFDELALQDDFERFSSLLLAEPFDTFMYRDFQARNVMLKDGNIPYFIDFQGGRRGPVYYDVASFLWQAKANYSSKLREELLSVYLQRLSELMPVDEAHFRKQLRYFVLFRTLQVLGAYGFRGYVEKKTHFLQSVPYAIDNLKDLLKTPFTELPYLNELLKQMVELPKLQHPIVYAQNRLTIRIFSFSYKIGIPEDTTGNGGGYVFDCRSTHNPGRYDEYKQKTGLDQEVIDFLEKDGEITTFLESVYALADAHVQRYLERGFTDLMFSFGCTGGQHRSVYSAEHLAHHLAENFDVDVVLEHREQHIVKQFIKDKN